MGCDRVGILVAHEEYARRTQTCVFFFVYSTCVVQFLFWGVGACFRLRSQERMGPGGLDPVEIFGTLPEEMQVAFQTKDTPMLKKALLAMTAEDRK